MLKSTSQLTCLRIAWDMWVFLAGRIYGRKEVRAVFPWKLQWPIELLIRNSRIFRKDSNFSHLVAKLFPLPRKYGSTFCLDFFTFPLLLTFHKLDLAPVPPRNSSL